MTFATRTKPGMRPKEFHFPLSVEWTRARRVAVRIEGKPPVDVAPPPVFRGADPSVWSPEDLLVAASASCLAITFTGLAERAGLAYMDLEVDADGVASVRGDGRFGFTRLTLRLTVTGGEIEELRRLADKAEDTCLVSASLACPVDVEIDVRGTA
jgi:organic hydroperoxide reductase OsmC/OhrA